MGEDNIYKTKHSLDISLLDNKQVITIIMFNPTGFNSLDAVKREND